MTLPGKTASRFLLSAARVVLSNEEFTNGYLPDFRGSKVGKVPIPQEAVDKLRGCRTHSLFDSSNLLFLVEAVRMRFAYNEADMKSVWTAIRTSLVQKVTDVRKSNKRRSLQSDPEQRSAMPSEQENASAIPCNSNDEIQCTSLSWRSVRLLLDWNTRVFNPISIIDGRWNQLHSIFFYPSLD